MSAKISNKQVKTIFCINSSKKKITLHFIVPETLAKMTILEAKLNSYHLYLQIIVSQNILIGVFQNEYLTYLTFKKKYLYKCKKNQKTKNKLIAKIYGKSFVLVIHVWLYLGLQTILYFYAYT